MDPITWFVEMVDLFLIAPYRWPKNPIMGWWLGTFTLSVWSGILGELTVALACRINHSHMLQASREMVERHNQSMNALQAGDKAAYKAINKLANEAYGKTFFLQLAMASASLWPIPFAFAWLQARFSGVHFALPFSLPSVGDSVGYPFVFVPLYVLVRIVIGKVKKHLPSALSKRT
jgi:hypothetical protein